MVRSSATNYLRQDVQIEPLFGPWRAWAHLIPPATAALRIAARYLPLTMGSIDRAIIPAAADNNSAPVGVPLEKITESLNGTLLEQADLLRLAGAIRYLENLLSHEAKGQSLSSLYPKIPEALKGFVELVYDSNNHPSIRFIEGLLYQSPHYKRSMQSCRMRGLESDESRLDILAPRLNTADSLHLNLHFSAPELDLLLRARRHATSFARLKESLGLEDGCDDLFQTFLTENPPLPGGEYPESNIRIRYFGHASVLIESGGCAILVDPLIGYDHPSPIQKFSYQDLPDSIDYVLITHGHQDHLDLESLIQIRHLTHTVVVPKNGSGVLLDPSLKLLLQNIGFKNVLELDDMESIELRHGMITAIPFLGEHSDLNIRAKTSYAVRLNDSLILFLADACNLETAVYRRVHEFTGDADIMFIGMECEGSPLSLANGPYLFQPFDETINQSRRTQASNSQQAIEVVDQFNCKQVYVYAMGLEPWLRHLFGGHIAKAASLEDSIAIRESNKFIAECRQRQITAERLFGSKEIFL